MSDWTDTYSIESDIEHGIAPKTVSKLVVEYRLGYDSDGKAIDLVISDAVVVAEDISPGVKFDNCRVVLVTPGTLLSPMQKGEHAHSIATDIAESLLRKATP